LEWLPPPTDFATRLLRLVKDVSFETEGWDSPVGHVAGSPGLRASSTRVIVPRSEENERYQKGPGTAHSSKLQAFFSFLMQESPMNKIFLGLAASVAGLVLTGTADAHPGHGRVEHHRVVAHAPYRSHAVRFSGGYYFPGHDHHWARRVWDERGHRFIYFDGSMDAYFYWYAPANCYYPVTYCP
jgi:hypothetical protein